MNENDGWMRSCSEQPAQGAWVWWNARKPQNALAGTREATSARRSTSAIIRNITKPR